MASLFKDIFEAKDILTNINIRLCARIEHAVKHLLALVTVCGDIVLHYTLDDMPAVVRRIPWYKDKKRIIQALCFDPTATWLLVTCADGSLHIIPFLSIVDKKLKVDCKWSINDLTSFPKPQQTPDCKPTSIVWWQTLDCNQNGLIGYENGVIALISLTDGRCLATCSVNDSITDLTLCQEGAFEAIFLLINGASGQQWKLVLEQHYVGYVWPPELTHQSNDPIRAKVFGFKQLSVERLVSLGQRLVEGRNSKRENGETTSESLLLDTPPAGPEPLPHLADTHFASEYAKDQYLFSAFYKPVSLLTVHAGDVETAPLYTHKLPPHTDSLVLTDKLIFTIDTKRTKVSVVSSFLSECKLEEDTAFDESALVFKHRIKHDHGKILKIYKVSPSPCVNGKKIIKKGDKYPIPKTIDDIDILPPKVDTCLVVTNKSVFMICVKVSPAIKFVQLAYQENDHDNARKLSDTFGLSLSQQLEACGDLFITVRKNPLYAAQYYRQAKVPLLKRVLKVALFGDSKGLLKYVNQCLSTEKADMSMATKIHIGNLGVMASTELILRSTGTTKESYIKNFMNFLRYEDVYDQVLAVNVVCQASQWDIVNLLAKARGLQPEVVSAYGEIIKSAKAPKSTDLNFLYALSESTLIQGLLLSPRSAEIIFKFIRVNVEHFSTDVLMRFAILLDPSQPSVIPLVSKKFRCYKSSMSLESTLDSSDCDSQDRSPITIKDLIETFIVVLTHLVAKTDTPGYSSAYFSKINGPEEPTPEEHMEKFPEVQPLSCGFEHAAVVRNDLAYTMGLASSGCLGLGPILTQSSPPRMVQTLAELRVKVISVSCGRKHTLFLTDYGVFSCGSNCYGQLGLGSFLEESPYPQILTDLGDMKIVEVACGQYHSLALTASGQVYTWGWGIHGQLGHGSSNNETRPKLLNFNKKIKQVTAGHAHSIVLTTEGELFGFGSNVFGQLEISHGTSNKYSKPIHIYIMPDMFTPVLKVSSSHFHNIAVLENQEVHVWGASPQEVRVFLAKNHQKPNGISVRPPPDSCKKSVNVYTNKTTDPIEQVSIGYRQTAILLNGKILWGKNKDDDLTAPQLREEDTLNILNHRFLHVSCGMEYTMAIDHIGRVLAWGSVSMAQSILGKPHEKDAKADDKVIISRNTKRVLRVPNNAQGNGDSFPIEVPGLPSMAITFNPTDHQLLFLSNFIPYSIIKIENKNIQTQSSKVIENGSPLKDKPFSPTYKFGQKTLHYVLETYYPIYDSDYIQQICLNVENYQAASKIAILGEHYCDSLGFQLEAFKLYMNLFETDFKLFVEEYEAFNQGKKQEDYVDLIKNVNSFSEKNTYSNSPEQVSSSTPGQMLSTSSSLDSMRVWDDQEHQGGCESPCEAGDIGDIRYNMSQFVQSLKNNQMTAPISSVSKLVSEGDKIALSNEFDFEIKNRNVKNIIEMASCIIEFYIKKIYSSENHILMQNILMQIIEFWLLNSLPVPILEGVLLKHLDKYFYPLSILLFCKDFSTDSDENVPVEGVVQKNSARFLKEFSTKFCLQLCLMVVENVNKA